MDEGTQLKYESPSKKELEEIMAKHDQHLSPKHRKHVEDAIAGVDHTDFGRSREAAATAGPGLLPAPARPRRGAHAPHGQGPTVINPTSKIEIGNKPTRGRARSHQNLWRGGPGRKQGEPNKVTIAVREAAAKLVDDPIYQAKLAEDFRARKVHPTIEAMFWYYAKGKPRDTVTLDVSLATLKQEAEKQIRRLTDAQLEALLASTEQSLAILEGRLVTDGDDQGGAAGGLEPANAGADGGSTADGASDESNRSK